MISLEEYKKALGPYVEELSEEEILRAREIQDKMAEILFYDWLENLNKKDIQAENGPSLNIININIFDCTFANNKLWNYL